MLARPCRSQNDRRFIVNINECASFDIGKYCKSDIGLTMTMIVIWWGLVFSVVHIPSRESFWDLEAEAEAGEEAKAEAIFSRMKPLNRMIRLQMVVFTSGTSTCQICQSTCFLRTSTC